MAAIRMPELPPATAPWMRRSLLVAALAGGTEGAESLVPGSTLDPARHPGAEAP